MADTNIRYQDMVLNNHILIWKKRIDFQKRKTCRNEVFGPAQIDFVEEGLR